MRNQNPQLAWREIPPPPDWCGIPAWNRRFRLLHHHQNHHRRKSLPGGLHWPQKPTKNE